MSIVVQKDPTINSKQDIIIGNQNVDSETMLTRTLELRTNRIISRDNTKGKSELGNKLVSLK